jgi:hypothetical protein
MHPLDLSEFQGAHDDNGNIVTVCLSTITVLTGLPELDALFGDTFMRNVYSMYVPLLYCESVLASTDYAWQPQLRQLRREIAYG